MTNQESFVLAMADRLQTELYEALGRLIRARSENHGPTGDENHAQPEAAALFAELGLVPDTYSPMDLPDFDKHPAYRSGHHLEDRTNVCARWSGIGGGKSTMICGHIDTVPIGDESAWSFPPLIGDVADGFVRGRGAGDDKSGIAVGWYAVRVLQACGIRLKGDVVLGSYCDEENGGGHGALAAVLKYPCDAYLNLDGSNAEIGTSATGGGIFRIPLRLTRITETASPIYQAVRALTDALEVFGTRRRAELEAHPLFRGTATAAQAYRLYSAQAGNAAGMNLDRGEVNFICYSLLPQTAIDGELTAILEQLTPLFEELGVQAGPIEHTTRYFAPVLPEREPAIADLLAQTVREIRGTPAPREPMCLSDHPMFYHYGGGEALCFGLMGGFSDPGGAHQTDERIACADLLDEAKIVLLFLLRYCQ